MAAIIAVVQFARDLLIERTQSGLARAMTVSVHHKGTDL